MALPALPFRIAVRSYFEKGLEMVCEELAKSIARDGEGATKFVEILVRGASDFEAARKVAKTIAHSPLVKTALYGEELNWGRILCAVGYSGVAFDPERITLSLNGIPIFRNGSPVSSTRARAEKAMKAKDLLIRSRSCRWPRCSPRMDLRPEP